MSIPKEIQAVLPADTVRAWTELAPHLPQQLVLVGGTALAVHLQHRISRDLDFFYTEPGVDLPVLKRTLERLPSGFAVTLEDPGTLNGVYGGTKVQFMDATTQTQIAPPTLCAGLKIASLEDILATKVKVVGDRPALRDYFDLKVIEERTGMTAEEGLRLYMHRYDVSADDTSIRHIILALGYLGDVDPDDQLPETKASIERYWAVRQPQIASYAARVSTASATQSGTAPVGGGNTPTTPASGAGSAVWVEEYERSDGTRVSGHWRNR